MTPLLLSALCVALVVIAGGSLYRKRRIARGTYLAIVAILLVLVAVSAVLVFLGMR